MQFCNGLSGLAPHSELGLGPGQVAKEVFAVGQVGARAARDAATACPWEARVQWTVSHNLVKGPHRAKWPAQQLDASC